MSKVFVGMSGGVDSSVSAALLKEAGYDVTGVFIKTWHPDFIHCTWRGDRQDAMDVCARLGIPFRTLDLEEEYKRDVVEYMVSEYKAGRTPNPDVMCNRHIKFGAFYTWARAEGADAIATGHYARNEQIPNPKSQFPKMQLLAGVDTNKDQSYFLWTLSQDILPHVLFPVGNLTKPEVRKIAERFNLSVATKKDSQGVCFLGKVEMKEFLKRYIDAVPGNLLNEAGEVIGTHDGAFFYTLGERRGFTVTKKTPTDAPYYVIAKDVEQNTVTVSVSRTGENDSHAVCSVELETTNWINEEPQSGKEYRGRFRYRQPLEACTIDVAEGHVVILFDKPQASVAPGQSLVLYTSAQAGEGEVCIGGGVIKTVHTG